MEALHVIHKKEQINIDKSIFCLLLDLPFIQIRKPYQDAIKENKIKLSILKELSGKAEVPYPLFFAPLSVVEKQIADRDKEIEDKMPTKDEINLTFRGKMRQGEIQLIVNDLARKQQFLKKYVLSNSPKNEFIGLISKWKLSQSSTVDIANRVRDYFNIDLNEMRKLSKAKVLHYLIDRIENKYIFVSFSSFQYMPQEISKEIHLSGVCIKDRSFPFIFMNTRDGDDSPLIIESDGRQIFTLISMVVCLGQNKFILSTKKGQINDQNLKELYSIVSEILIPKQELEKVVFETIEELKERSHLFKVTPSMLLTSLHESKLINSGLYNKYMNLLSAKQNKTGMSFGRHIKPVDGFGRYNGERFSREVVKAFNIGKVSRDDFQKILFRKGKINESILKEYINKFR